MADEKDPPKEKAAPGQARMPNAKVAADRTREAAQWMVKAAGGGAAALLASLKLSDLGDLDGLGLFLALLGAAVGLAGVTWILVVMGNVIAPKHLSANDVRKDPDLRQRAEADASGWLRGYESLDQLIGDYDRADRARVKTYKQVLAAEARNNTEAMVKAQAAHDRAADELTLAGAAIDRLLDYAMTRRTLQQWRHGSAAS